MSEATGGRQEKRKELGSRSLPAAAAAITEMCAKDADSAQATNTQGDGSTFTLVFDNPSDFLATLEPELSLRPKQSNIIYAHAHKLRQSIRAGKRVQPGQYWIALYSCSASATSALLPSLSRTHSSVSTADPNSNSGPGCTSPFLSQRLNVATSMGRPCLQFVLSCTTGHLGDYPIFIYSAEANKHNKSPSSYHSVFLPSHMLELASRLYELVPPSRVFSVFAPHKVTTAFASAWNEVSGVDIVRGPPWYSATSSFCTLETFRGSNMLQLNNLSDIPSPLPPPFKHLPASVPECEALLDDQDHNRDINAGWYQIDEDQTLHSMRRATMDDLDECAKLCQEFAETSPPFVLTADRARLEAEEMIRHGLVWVYGLTTTTSPSPSSPSSSLILPSPSCVDDGLCPASPEKKTTTITTLVAVTRSTPTVSAITKVYTTYRYRRRGYADRLVAHVTRYLLEEEKKEAVVLFVGHTLDAVRVYRRIGFVGLDRLDGREAEMIPDACEGTDVEDWLELGFEGGELGHW